MTISVLAPLYGPGLFAVRARALPPPKGSDISAPVSSNSVDIGNNVGYYYPQQQYRGAKGPAVGRF